MPHYGAGRTIELVGDCEDLYAIAETVQLSKASALAEGFDTGSEAVEDLRRSLVNGGCNSGWHFKAAPDTRCYCVASVAPSDVNSERASTRSLVANPSVNLR